MTRVVRTRRAEQDLLSLWRYTAQHDDIAADRLLRRIADKLDRLADHPGIGQSRPGRIADLRSVVLRPYILLYQPIADGIRLIRVLHGARDAAAILHGD